MVYICNGKSCEFAERKETGRKLTKVEIKAVNSLVKSNQKRVTEIWCSKNGKKCTVCEVSSHSSHR